MPHKRASAADASTTLQHCFHCSAPLPPGESLHLTIARQRQPVCCAGCLAAAKSILDAGLQHYYEFRTLLRGPVHELSAEDLAGLNAYDLPEVQQEWIQMPATEEREVALLLSNIVCPACTWLIEQRVRGLPGVLLAELNYTTHRMRVRWRHGSVCLSDILKALANLGYPGQPYQPEQRELTARAERRRLLLQLGVAAALGMQVMMLTIAVYVVDPSGIEPLHVTLINALNLLLTLPVVLYSGQAFLVPAGRDLAQGRLSMDVPVALGILLAFVASVVGTLHGSLHTYYDSVTMFILLLLAGRYVELLVRHRAAAETEHFHCVTPVLATRLVHDAAGDLEERVLVSRLVRDDRVRIKPGERIPVDGRVVAGRSSVDEAVLTGESRPVPKEPGSAVMGGSINIDNVLVMRVEKRSCEGIFAAVQTLVHKAQAERPQWTAIADRWAPWFIAGVLLLATVVAGHGLWVHDSEWFDTMLAVLVVTCPCALSLAAPATLTAASNRLLRAGVLVRSGSALEALSRITHIAFDKTGTLTGGDTRIVATYSIPEFTVEHCLQIAATLEQASDHPIARTLHNAGSTIPNAYALHHTPGGGVTGVIDGQRYYCGSRAYAGNHLSPAARNRFEAELKRAESAEVNATTRVVLTDDRRLIGVLYLDFELRPQAPRTVAALQARGLQVMMLTGDRPEIAGEVAGLAGMATVHADLLPEGKLQRLQSLQQQGARVAMVGDGINDAPVLAAADVSVALACGTDLARAQADYVIMGDDLSAVAKAHAVAVQAMTLLRQNLVWAVSYNMTALPAAVLGWLDPWVAALGMALSSLLVVSNALRLK